VHETRTVGTDAQFTENMKDDGEIRKEAINLMTGPISSKQSCKIGTWNVRTMYESTKTAQVVKEMTSYNIGILGIAECRWTGQGQTTTKDGHLILYSGHESQHMYGVAIIIQKRHVNSLIDWKPISDRIIKARFQSRHCKLTIIQCYAPTNDKDGEVKQEFYDQLQSIRNSVPKHDMCLVLGDMNAKVGTDRTGVENAMGHFGIGTRNENGELLLEFCLNNDMVVGGTLFQHKNIHKYTWTTPDGQTRNMIDHIMINRKWVKSMQDCRSYRGADIFSDHELVVSKIKLKLKRTGHDKKSEIGRQYDSSRLKDPVIKNEFVLKLRNRFQVLEDLNDETEITWTSIKENFQSTAKEILGHKKPEKKDWISEETWIKIEERKKLKNKIHNAQHLADMSNLKAEYTAKDKEVKKCTRKDKRDYIDNLAEKAQRAADFGNMKTVYNITKQLSGKYSKKSGETIKAKDGKLLTTEKEVAERWKSHFEEVLNRPEPEITAEPEPGHEIDIDIRPPTIQEVKAAIHSLKNDKAPGPDLITAEMLKADIDLSARTLTDLFDKIWRQEKIPTDWSKGIIIKLPKKGDLNNCDNWRGIMLLSIPSKVLCKVILNRIDEKIDNKLREEQAGFRAGKGCVDQIFTLRTVIEQCVEFNKPLHVNFVDFSKAFDSIHRQTLWKILRSYGIPEKMIIMITKFYDNFQACVSVGNNKTSDFFKISTGVRQGCILSPILFILVIDWVMKKTTEDKKRGLQLGILGHLEDLDFADDLALISETIKHLQAKTDRLVKYAGQVGLFVNVKKTEIMNIPTNPDQTITINGEQLKQSNKFTYLGSVISSENGSKADIKTRIDKARVAFNSLHNVWNSKKLALKTKIRLYNSNVKSVLLYGAECWRTVKTETNQLNAFHNSCLRRICKIFWPNKISNLELYAKTKCNSIEAEVKYKRLRWLGHVLRMEQNRFPKKCLKWNPTTGKRNRGQPKMTWRRSTEKDLFNLKLTWGEAEALAKKRNSWRSRVAVFSGLHSPKERRD
jgi:hypothetical protein